MKPYGPFTLTDQDFAPMTDVEIEVRDALTGYKLALVDTNYRGLSHRIGCWFKVPECVDAEAELVRAFERARDVANRSPAHQHFVRQISANQPDFVREQDEFVKLL